MDGSSLRKRPAPKFDCSKAELACLALSTTDHDSTACDLNMIAMQSMISFKGDGSCQLKEFLPARRVHPAIDTRSPIGSDLRT
ncbi:hypothetical protein PMT_1385 [Prochlorococcus marinus str. MIT 9313]|uniref:Uncharacterized protein n=1 Tax=Prochlorococcus marinus (strain MIT 9313) TaxID=74547 RepID=Q7V5Z8_PROMM|nr:hypothetical protein PMT_1385 [Prochlorococcus marinus str. MIT 9313]